MGSLSSLLADPSLNSYAARAATEAEAIVVHANPWDGKTEVEVLNEIRRAWEGLNKEASPSRPSEITMLVPALGRPENTLPCPTCARMRDVFLKCEP